MVIQFTIPGAPVGKARARSRVVNTKSGQSFVSHYTPKETTSYENLVKLAFRLIHAGPPTDQPVTLQVIAWFPIPGSWSQKKRNSAEHIPCTVKPDWDNVGKIISDALNEIAWLDDKQIHVASVQKFYSLNPRTDVVIQYQDEQPKSSF